MTKMSNKKLPQAKNGNAARLTRRNLLLSSAAVVGTASFMTMSTRTVFAATGGSDSLIIAVDSDADTLDPTFANLSKPGQTALVNSLDALHQAPHMDQTVRGVSFPGVDSQSLAPMLSTSFTIEDGRAIYQIRDGAKWADGTPITAETLVGSYRRMFEAEGIAAFLLRMVTVMDPSYVEALPGNRLALRMDTPNELVFPVEITTNLPLSPVETEAHAEDGDPGANKYYRSNIPASSGPYNFKSYRPGESYVLERNEDYYGDSPSINTITQRIVPDASQRVLALKQGDVDMIFAPATRDLEALRQDENIDVFSVPTIKQVRLYMHNKIAPFDKKEVRFAFNYATPYEAILKTALNGAGGPFKSVVPDGMPTSNSDGWDFDTNLENAAKQLEMAGHAGGDGLPKIKLSIKDNAVEAERTAVLLKASLSQIGVTIDIQKLPFASFTEQKQARRLQLFIDEDVSFVNDPFYWLALQIPPNSPNNFVDYENEKVVNLVTDWTLSKDTEGRNAASKEVQRLINEDMPWVYLYSPNFNIAMRKNVTGWRYYSDELPRYAFMSKSV